MPYNVCTTTTKMLQAIDIPFAITDFLFDLLLLLLLGYFKVFELFDKVVQNNKVTKVNLRKLSHNKLPPFLSQTKHRKNINHKS